MDSRLLRQLQRSLVSLIGGQDTLAIKKVLEEKLISDQQFSLDDDFVADTSCSDSQTYLQHAVRSGNLATIALFIDSGADVNAVNKVGETALYTACDYIADNIQEKARLRVVEYLLKRGAGVDVPNDAGWTPLMRACAQLDVSLAKLLLGAKANTDHTDCEGNSALHLSLLASGPVVKIGSIVDLLARQGADVNQYNKEKMTPIMIASQRGWCNTIQTFLLAGSDLSCVDGEQSTCLSLAAQSQHTDAVRLLLQNGADPSITNYRWVSPLLFAVMNLDEQTVGVILSTSRKATINLADCEGTTPMLYAVKAASHSAEGLHGVAGCIVKELLRHGCDVNTQHETNGDTPLILAARTACAGLVEFLLANGADTNMADCCGETALHSCLDSFASDASLLSLFYLLVSFGSDVNLRNKNGLTALHKAAHKGCSTEILKFLREAGTELAGVSKDSNRYSILQSSVSSLAVNSTLYLIDIGCDVNQQSAAGETALSLSIRLQLNQVTRTLMSLPNCDLDAGGRNAPLHVATELGKEPIVVELLNRGADVNKRNGRGDTPLQIAIEGYHLRIVKRLLSAGCTIEYQGLSPLSPLALLRGSFTPPDRQPLFLVVQYDDLELFKQLLARYHRKPYHLLRTLHDILTIDNEPSRRGNQMMSREGRCNLLALLREELSTLPSLLEMCRGQLRKVLGGKRTDLKVNSLPLPLSLKHFVMYDMDRNLDLSDLDSD